MNESLDLYPYQTPSGAHVTMALAKWAMNNNPTWEMTFNPRPGYEQDQNKYPA